MRLKHRLELGLVRLGFALGFLWPWTLLSGLGAILGRFLFHVIRLRRRLVMSNLRLAFGSEKSEAELRRIAAACYEQAGRSYFEYFALPTVHRRRVLGRVRFENREALAAAQSGGRGVICLASHFGNWELLALAIRELGIDLQLMVGDLSNTAVDEEMNRLRRRLGFTILRRGMGIRDAVKLLRSGGALGFQGDQEARWHGVEVPFFGRVSLTHPGAASLSIRTGAAILPVYLRRDGKSFIVRFLDPIIPPAQANDEAVRDLTARHTAVLESYIREYPEHWFWLHRRWKRAPRGEDGLPLKA